ncbi:unnamed protein product [Pieris brassicae]|uniref:Uncharacterized protein n=1 Tax=Pieris brassicae TaxID=7116 RepID=A0A9P0T3G2_PIEBR|nr:unnamed protein product [Pieris brassicae]
MSQMPCSTLYGRRKKVLRRIPNRKNYTTHCNLRGQRESVGRSSTKKKLELNHGGGHIGLMTKLRPSVPPLTTTPEPVFLDTVVCSLFLANTLQPRNSCAFKAKRYLRGDTLTSAGGVIRHRKHF